MAGGVATALHGRPPGDGDTGLFEVDEFWLGQVVDELQPRALLLANLFRDQLDRYGELDTIADRWAAWSARTAAALVLNADDPLVADLGRARVGATYFGVRGRRAWRWPRCSTPPTPSTAGAAARPTSTTRSTSATSAATTATTAAPRAPEPQVARHDVVLRGRARRALHAAHAGGRARDRAAAARALQRLQRARRRGARRWRSAPRSTRSPPACRRSPPPSAAPRRSALGGRELSILLVKNPAGANEVLRTLALEPGEHDVLAVLNDNIADGRDVSWVWDADFEVLAPPRAARDVQRHARRRDGAAPEVRGRARERIAVEPELDAGLDRRAGGGDGRALRPADLHRDARAARPARRAAARPGRRSHDAPSRALARPRVRRLRRTTCRCGASWPRARAAPVLDVGAGTGRVALDLAARGHEVVALDLDAGCSRRCASAAAACRSRRSPPTRATSPSVAASRWSSCRCRRCSCSAAPTAARASSRRARAHLAPGGLLAVALADALEAFDAEHDQPPAARPARDRRRGLRQPPDGHPRPRRPRRHRARPRGRRARRRPARSATT